eukprot:scaffold912_cov119-Cylindrotheca_fusiformis.AAC.13
MWSNNDDYNDNGEAVKLYLPSQGPPRKSNTAPLDSHIGGEASDFDSDLPACAKCQSAMYLFVQLRLKESASKEDRFLCVYGCPRSDCFNQVSFENGFASGGQGIMCCKRYRKEVVPEIPSAPETPVKSSWYDDNDDDDDDDNDWDSGNDDDIVNLENAVAAMEANLEGGVIPKTKKEPKATPKESTNTPKHSSSSSFRCFMLNQIDEPPAPRPQIEEDDVGNAASDDKIRNMLARYMAEEEDQDILAALKGSNTNGGGNGGEEDERLSEKDRILLGFQDRLRRASRQVIRYARGGGGAPLWSIPSSNNNNNNNSSESKGTTKEPYWTVPPCSCGATRLFECQLLPSLLHVLEVDKFAGGSNNTTSNNGSEDIHGLLSNGMNWGSIAVFTCPNNCDETEEEALVIQKTVDEVNEMQGHQQPQMDFGPVIAVVEDMEDDGDFEPDI